MGNSPWGLPVSEEKSGEEECEGELGGEEGVEIMIRM